MTTTQAWSKKRPFVNHLRMLGGAKYIEKLDDTKPN
jgi:hypothetical protein